MHRTPRAPRQRVLLVLDGLGGIEVYGEALDVHVCHVPAVEHWHNESAADHVAHARLPWRFRDLWRADWLRAVDTTRPMTVVALAAAQATHDALVTLDRLAEPEQRRASA